jgi:hypothetical protein
MAICSRHAAFTVTLWEPPRFYQTENSLTEALASLSLGAKNTPESSRLVRPAGMTSGHPDVLGQLLIYRICVSPVDFDLMTKRIHEQAVVTMYYRTIKMVPPHQIKGLHKGMEDLKRAIQASSLRVPFSVLYQLEALVRNGFLLPWTVRQLLDKMKQRFADAPDSSHHTTVKVRQRLALIFTHSKHLCVGVFDNGQSSEEVNLADSIPWAGRGCFSLRSR